MRHIGYCISEKLVERMLDTGVEMRIGVAGFFKISPGDDAYVDGAVPVDLILFALPDHQH